MAFSSSSSENNFGDRTSRDNKFGGRPRPSPAAEPSTRPRTGPGGFQFDILSWYPKYQSCQRYFLDHAQHDNLVQAFASFVNILLPFQRENPIYSSTGATTALERHARTPPTEASTCSVSLVPYLRRLVATGMDVPQILHGFFGDDWAAGVGPQREQERRNFLFSAKSGGWASVKRDYDMLPLETIPFLRPLQEPADAEMEAAEKDWSEWLAMEDWMIGSRAPD